MLFYVHLPLQWLLNNISKALNSPFSLITGGHTWLGLVDALSQMYQTFIC